jgi:hypothetical protein
MEQIERVGILARLGITVTHCIAHHPQSKHVERFFRTMHEQFDRRWYQHYTGGAPHRRPDATTAAMTLHRKLMRHGRVAESTHPPASVFIALCLGWIEAEYHQRPHQGRGMDGQSPEEAFAGRAPVIDPIAPDALALLLEEHTRRKVRECAVELGKRRYSFTDAVSRDVLHDLNDTEVIVAHDPNDVEMVAILDEGGHFLTWARAEEHVRMDPGDPDTQNRIAQSMADRRHLEKRTRTQLEQISRAARAVGAKTPVEALAAKVAVVPAVEAVLTHRPPPKPKPSSDAKAPASAADIAASFLEALK